MRKKQLSFALDKKSEFRLIAGVDEAGRGPLAGHVVAAAVILDPDRPMRGLNDSKQLSAEVREKLYTRIVGKALAWSVGRASVQEIDQLNILWASMLAMKRAVDGLGLHPELVYVDGNRCPDWEYRSMAVIQGDGRLQAVAAASIVAKVTRDRELQALDARYPGYGLAQHKGYSTPSHLEALRRLGPCAIHRRSFQPVAELLSGESHSRYESDLIPATLPAED